MAEMTFVETELVDEKENNETPKPVEEPKEKETTEETKKGGFWHALGAPFRYVGGKIKESPAATVIGAVGGAGLALGGKVVYDHFARKNNGYEEEAPDPEIDYGYDEEPDAPNDID